MTPVARPGRLLKREIEARGLDAGRLALALGVPAERVEDVLAGRRPIDADAARLGRYFGNGAAFWTRLQEQHDAAREARGSEARPADAA